MAERSTAAVDVANSGGDGSSEHTSRPPASEAAAADGAQPQDGAVDAAGDTAGDADASADTDAAGPAASDTVEATPVPPDPATTEPGAGSPPADRDPQPADVPEPHSGDKLARRYRLEECVTRLDGFSSWRAVDEKLRRAVGVHLLPSHHRQVRPVLAAARSAALLGDPRFVQVLDAVEDGDRVYVVHEWLPDATPLTAVLAAGPLPAHECYELVSQLAQAMAVAHREGLAHLRLTPGSVLRTATGQYRVRGLAVNAALRGISSDSPQRTDTEAIGALLYAALTQRWPYEEDAYGLTGVTQLSGGTLIPPDQVRAGVHRGLSELAMRALVNDGATASSENPPCTTPEELAAAVAELPRIPPEEPTFLQPTPYERTTYQQGVLAPDAVPMGGGALGPVPVTDAPPTLPGRTGKVLKWGVSALLIAALGLGSWQVADALLRGDKAKGPAQSEPDPEEVSGEEPAGGEQPASGQPVDIASARILDPKGAGRESAEKAALAFDGDPGTYWQTLYYRSAAFGNLKPGVGLILDLGSVQQVSDLKVNFLGETSVDFLAAPADAAGRPDSLGDFSKVDSATGTDVTLSAKQPIRTRYVLVWLTELPHTGDGEYRGRITEIGITS
ncbi:protein kinase family protein [Streptomyces sp. JJ66]|uniref:protein kinase family protein n=1 Tax=Streptomyces sp. JJ66 TaxID=2803843 RepID=UPI001C5A250F|nr:protein kinase family protein [Streptomyces sp. JJ66]MBW1601758.1 protein kinase family protein [Streptomyces sp. JJ66]